MNNTHLIIKSDPLEISQHTIVMEIQPQPTFPCATLALPTLWLVVAGAKYNNGPCGHYQLCRWGAPSQSNCEVMKQVPSSGQPGIHEYSEYRLTGNINTEYSVTISRAINIIVIHNNPLTKLGEGDQLSTLALNYSQPPLTPESKVRSDYKIRWKGGKILTNCHTSVLKYISKFSNSNV